MGTFMRRNKLLPMYTSLGLSDMHKRNHGFIIVRAIYRPIIGSFRCTIPYVIDDDNNDDDTIILAILI